MDSAPEAFPIGIDSPNASSHVSIGESAMTLEQSVRGLALLVELGDDGCSQDRIDTQVLRFVCGHGVLQTESRRQELAIAFGAAVPPSPLRNRVLDYIARC